MPLSNILAKEVFHESFQSRKNLARLPSYPFEKKLQSEPTRSPRIDFVVNSVITTLTIYPWMNILDFMNQLTKGRKPQTTRARFTSLLAFFNFPKNNLDPDFTNPCNSPMLRKLFRTKVKTQFDILEKENIVAGAKKRARAGNDIHTAKGG